MFPYKNIFEKNISLLKEKKHYRYFTPIERHANVFPMAYYHKEGQKKLITLWCSNDYLGQGCHKFVRDSMCKTIQYSGTGSGGTRNISGNAFVHTQLETQLAKWHNKERALLFTSGYVANDATLSTLGKILPNCVLFSDQKNHASIIQGIQRSGLKKHIFPHNDINTLEKQLQLYDLEQPKIIIFESVYSMDGDFGAIKEIVALSKKYGALTYLDEVHAIGMYGDQGAGLAQKLNLMDQIDIIQATLGKAIGCIGGYIASSEPFIDAIRSNASGFIFTTSLPPAITSAAIESIHILSGEEGHRLRAKHQEIAAKIKKRFKEENFPLIETPSHIIPVLIKDSLICSKISEILLNDFDIYIQPINYPTVDHGSERLRITPTPFHTDKQISDLITALKTIFSKFNLVH